VVSSATVKNERGALIVLSTLIIGAMWLVACGGAGSPTKVDERPLPTDTPAPPSASATSSSLPKATDSPSEPTVELIEPTVSDVSFATPAQPALPPAAASTETPVSPPPTPPVIQHTVQPGETLFGLAVDYGVSMAAIQLINGMSDSTDLIAGQTLSIPGSPQWPGESAFWVVHTAQAGETLVGLTNTYDLTVDEILRVNAIADPALIHVDQQLVLPLTQLVTLNAPQPTPTPVAIAAAPATAKTEASSETAPTATEPAEPVAPPPGPPSGPADWPNYILARINQARAEHGLHTLTVAPELTHAAQAHAEDCARRGWGSHVGSDGAVLKTRLERAGYFGSNWGENWVQALNAERAFDWWYGEIPPNDPHRRNILSNHYTEVGIGIAETGWGYIFITDFGRR
jgi:uncharacterized protein YkwD